MTDGRPLSAIFLRHLAESVRLSESVSVALEQTLIATLAESRSAWPSLLPLAPEIFLPFLARRVLPNAQLDQALINLRTSELYLVCACLNKDPQAILVFEREFLPEARGAVAKMRGAADLADDVQQDLCRKLLIPDRDVAPKLERYGGRGDLRSWIRVSATRAALDVLRTATKKKDLDDESLVDHLTAPGEDQELQYLKRLYRQEFKAAFNSSLQALSSRERNLLRLQLLDGLNIDEVGAIYNVHRATVARWNSKIREKLLSATRRALVGRLQINRHEFESIMRLIQSQFDVSICRQLGDAENTPPEPPTEEKG
jgi:RNA polymerase sigma-70 factor (ECF subfamily)